MGLTLNQKKTVHMVISKRECNGSKLRIGNVVLKRAKRFNYRLIAQNGKYD